MSKRPANPGAQRNRQRRGPVSAALTPAQQASIKRSLDTDYGTKPGDIKVQGSGIEVDAELLEELTSSPVPGRRNGTLNDTSPRPETVQNAVQAQTKETPKRSLTAYRRLLPDLKKNIDETDLQTNDGRGVFDAFPSNIPGMNYPVGFTYQDFLPLNFKTGFESGLSRINVILVDRQDALLGTIAKRVGAIMKSNETGNSVVVKNSKSLIFRIAFDFFLKNAPSTLFRGVVGEQSFRKNVGLSPLPELALYMKATEQAAPRSALEDHALLTISGMDIDNDGKGVFDDFVGSHVPGVNYRPGVPYRELDEITFKGSFNSLPQRQYTMGRKQIALFNQLGTEYSHAVVSNRPNNSAVRPGKTSALGRTVFDFFLMNAPEGWVDQAAGEQDLRKNLGLPPLPELEIYEHEVRKQMEMLAGE